MTDEAGIYVDGTIRALDQELAAARDDRGVPVRLEDGERLGHDQRGALYQFRLAYETVLPEGVDVQLEVEGRTWTAEVLQRSGLKVLLYVAKGIDGQVPAEEVRFAQLHADPIYLLEALRDATAALSRNGPLSGPADMLLGMLTEQGEGPDSAAAPSNDPRLNVEQNEAVGRCVTNDVWFVWGPPGTGKTTTLGRVIHRAADASESVLVTAHSNVAVDAALVAAHRVGIRSTSSNPVIRAGPAATQDARDCGLGAREQVLKRHPDLARRLDEVMDKLEAGSDLPSRLHREWQGILDEIRGAETGLVNGAQVIFATLSKALIDDVISKRVFDLVVVDEISMTFPAQVLVAASKAQKRLNLFGDFRQLPPIVKSDAPEARHFLARDVFTACCVDGPDAAGVTMLQEQYRMHPSIRETVSRLSYGGRLRDSAEIAEAREAQAKPSPFPQSALGWINTAAIGARWFAPATRRSRFNPVNALVSVATALEVMEAGAIPVLLTPYRAQVRMLSALALDAGLEDLTVGTIHRYQGSEAAVVILDLVDTGDRQPSRLYLGDPGKRLLTVAISRAQVKVIVVGDKGVASNAKLGYPCRLALSCVRDSRCEPPVRPAQWRPTRGFALSLQNGRVEPDQSSGAEVSVAVAPAGSPLAEQLGHLVSTWDKGHEWWSDGSGMMTLIAGTAHSPVSFDLTGANRFASVLHDLALGEPLGRTRTKGDRPDRATRHDRCGTCGGPIVPDRAGPYSVELVCRDCGGTRWANDREMQTWLRQVGPRCPDCRSAMKFLSGRSAPHGPFFGCTDYPRCRGTREMALLIDAAAHPDPPPPATPKSTGRRKKPNVHRRVCSICFLSKSESQFDGDGAICSDCV